MVQIPENIREDFMKLQQLQQQLQILMFQKQSVQVQISEIKNALKEVGKTQEREVYEIVGTVMVKKDKDELKKALDEKIEVLDLRASSIDKQIKKLDEEAKKIQEKVTKQLKHGG